MTKQQRLPRIGTTVRITGYDYPVTVEDHFEDNSGFVADGENFELSDIDGGPR